MSRSFRVRGGSIPAGYVLGRTAGPRGSVGLVPASAVVAAGALGTSGVAGGASGSSVSGGSSTLDSAALDSAFGSTEGQILQRGASVWQVLAPGTSVQYLKSGGASALNAWAQPSASSLSDYAATTWTPTDNSGAGLSLTVSFATYTEVGNLVTVFYDITYPATANANNTEIAGLPFTVTGSTQWPAMPVRTVNGAQTWTAAVVAGTTTFRFRDPTADTRVTNATLGAKHLAGMLVYQK